MKKFFIAAIFAALFFSCDYFFDQAPVTVTIIDGMTGSLSFAKAENESQAEISALPDSRIDFLVSATAGSGSLSIYYRSHSDKDIDEDEDTIYASGSKVSFESGGTQRVSFTVPHFSCDVFCK